MVESVDQDVMGDGVKGGLQVHKDEGCCFIVVQEGPDVAGGCDQGCLGAMVGLESGLQGVQEVVVFQVFGELLVD